MAQCTVRLSYGQKKEVGKVQPENGIIRGDAFSSLLFVLIIDTLFKIIKMRVGDSAETPYSVDDLKVSMGTIGAAQTVHEIFKRCHSIDGLSLVLFHDSFVFVLFE